MNVNIVKHNDPGKDGTEEVIIVILMEMTLTISLRMIMGCMWSEG